MLEPSLPLLLALTAVAFCAGVVDAVAGGGGLITLPALLTAGLPEQLAFGTNKGQSVFGSFASLLRYARAKLVDGRRATVAFPAGFVGSLIGGAGMLALDKALLRPIALVLLIGAGIFVAVRPLPKDTTERAPPKAHRALTIGIALVLGCYDGFFGPGTGTFLIVACVALLHDSLPRATAEAKVVNFASNLAAVALFASRGVIIWKLALPMAAGQFCGGLVGAQLAITRGGPLIRRVVLAVVVALVLKLGYDALHAQQ